MNKSKNENKVKIDKKSGSRAYNRLDMQISQALHFAIELYDNLDYLLIMDYYDDIALIHDESNPDTISYYQLKTSEESISINTAISEDWLTKLYLHFERPEFIVNELGFITNCPLTVTQKIVNEDGKKENKTTKFTEAETSFDKFNEETLRKIKSDIAKKTKKDVKDIDLSKFVHIRTTLSIAKHKDIVEKEMSDFLYEKQPKITLDVVKAINSSMIELLTKRQSFELLSDDADLPTIIKHKSVSKRDFIRIIDAANIIAIPPFEEIEKVLNYGAEKYLASYEYTKLLTDSKHKSISFSKVFSFVNKICSSTPKSKNQTLLNYADTVCDKLYSQNLTYESMYNRTYIHIMVTCILINKERSDLQ